ncbi:alpha-amylase family glycosyl hydrolase [Inconstantimicrobium mannanitabidum]|uniref:Alpha-amylase n=1 Tax=Inconstantimicrobium mannanitabidum TaxID=1604901 RepID=A0ACB5RBE3_9CLOT|nr:alpha-amylase family glycosyl hydrolase [Clostridium sp. TW13]GKX66547.1 alpha-amylase [Clostridium sp. TW13]
MRKSRLGRLVASLIVIMFIFSMATFNFSMAATTNVANTNLTVHFKNISGWGIPNIYYYASGKTGPSWPGIKMNSEANGWYSYTISGWSSASVLFNDGKNQMPGPGQPGVNVTQESWYKDGKLYTSNPEQTIIPTSISITSASSVNVGSTIPLSSIVTYSDGSQKNDSATWTISDSTVGTLDSTTGSQVNLKGVTKGTVTVTASVGSISVSKSITIVDNQVSSGIKVHFYTTWTSPKIYYWAVQPTSAMASASWPGVAMTAEGNGWYNYQFNNVTSTNIIFNGSNQQTADLSRTSGEWWYKDNAWYSSNPDKDVTAPTVTTTPSEGNQEATSLDVTLNVKDDKDSNPKAYYTIDGTDPVIGQNLYSGKINIAKDTIIKVIAVDASGNKSSIYTFSFKLGRDVTPPVVTTSVAPDTYKDGQIVSLTVKDNMDPNPKVYYTTDGSEPTTNSALYNGTGIAINKTTTISTLGIDSSGNKVVQYFRFVIGNDVTRTDFRDESIYFVITTRFYDGDTTNNVHCWDDTKAGNPDSDPAWRGDFEGLIQKLDYIKALGFSAVWITPIVKNASGYDYHGYHAINFSEIDPRYATKSKGETAEQSYQRLINEAHKRGMKIIQDIVLNHTSNFGEENLFPMFKRNSPTGLNETANNAITQVINPWLPKNYDSLTPSQQFDARISAMKNDSTDTNNIYHHEKSLSWESYTVQTGQIAGDCVDLNTENPAVQNYLTKAYDKYIDMGVDSFRVDTVKHISRLDFNNSFIPEFKKRGGDNFYMFGEVCSRYRDVWNSGIPAISAPFYTWKESKTYPWGDLAANTQSVAQNWQDNSTTANQPTSNNAFLNGNSYHTPDWSKRSGLDVIDFPMHWAFNNARDAFSTALGGDKYYSDPTWNVTYVDSHDYAPDGAPENQRFAGSQDTWAENLDLMFTFRGIPCILYGSEVEFQKGMPIDVGPNAPLSKTGRAYFGDKIEGNVSVTDFGKYTNATGTMAQTLNYPLAQHIRRLNQIRRAVPALRRGEYSTEGVSGDGMAFKRRYTDSSKGIDSYCLVSVSGNATFTGVLNGTYVDVITGDTKTVTNGTLTANCSGKGNMRVYVLNLSGNAAPGKVGDAGTYLK